MKRYKYAFLINLFAGSGYVEKLISQMPVYLCQMRISREKCCIEQTRIGEVQKQAQNLSKLADSVVVFGGDGTVSDTIAGVSAGDSAAKVGIVPLGTANDLARTLNINQLFLKNPFHKALELLLYAKCRPFDIWQINGKRIMSNYLSIGFDAAVNASFCRERQMYNIPRRSLMRTKIAFCKHGFNHFAHRIRRGTFMHFRYGGNERKIPLGSLCGVIFSNIKHYASGIGPAPFSEYNDGYLDITLFPTLPHYMGHFVTQKLRQIHGVYRRNLIQCSSDCIDVYSPPGNYLQVDGEDRTELLQKGKITIRKSGQVKVLTVSGQY